MADLSLARTEIRPQSKYARIERERRFLLDRFPSDVQVTQVRHIVDRYIESTTLRLREMREENGPTVFKFTQKIPERAGSGGQQGHITNIYLDKSEFDLLTQLPAKMLCKTRHSVPPFGVDVFEGALHGLILAEAEFDSAVQAEALMLPSFIRHEITADERFTGGRLIRASRPDLRGWLVEYGIQLGPP